MGCSGASLTRVRALQDGETPLYVAAQNGHDEIVRFLVEEGGDVTAKTKVSERRVGSERKGVEEKSFRGRVVNSLGRSSHTCQDDCFLAPTDDSLQTTNPTMRCGCRFEGLLLHKMCSWGCWVCLWVRGVALMDVRYPGKYT